VRASSSVNASSVLPAILRARLSNARSNAGPERRTVKPWRIAFRLTLRLRSTAFLALNYSFHMIRFSPLGTKNDAGRVEASARADLAQDRQMDVGILYSETFVLLHSVHLQTRVFLLRHSRSWLPDAKIRPSKNMRKGWTWPF
jgi:hypothetical protein